MISFGALTIKKKYFFILLSLPCVLLLLWSIKPFFIYGNAIPADIICLGENSYVLMKTVGKYGGSKALVVADDLKKGVIDIGENDNWPKYRGELDDIWSGDFFDNRTLHYRLHSLFILYRILAAYQMNGDVKLLREGNRIISSWIEHNPRIFSPNRFSWGDHSTANRAIAMCVYYDYCLQHHIVDTKLSRLVSRSLFEHGEYLANPVYYRNGHNHGIFQDFALLVVANHLKTSTGITADWISLALSRLSVQIMTTFSGNGVHLENSPGYHILVGKMLNTIKIYLEESKIAVPTILSTMSDKINNVTPLFIMPDGCIVPVGDTARGHKYTAVPQGIEEVPNFDQVYPEEGYTALRGKLMLFFAATNNINSHKHCDDLEVLLYLNKKPVFTESGFLNYENNDYRREYTLSWYAHNTIVDENDKPVSISKSCGLIGYGNNDQISIIEGISLRKSGDTHKRLIIYDRKNCLILISDKCFSLCKTEWQRRFLLDPSIKINRKNEKELVINTANNDFLHFLSFGNGNKLVSGGSDVTGGWIAVPYSGLMKNRVLTQNKEGNEVFFLLAMYGGADKDISFGACSHSKITMKIGGIDREIIVHDDSIEIIDKDKTSTTMIIPFEHYELHPQIHIKRPLFLKQRVVLLVIDILGWLMVGCIVILLDIKKKPGGFAVMVCAVMVNMGALLYVYGYLF